MEKYYEHPSGSALALACSGKRLAYRAGARHRASINADRCRSNAQAPPTAAQLSHGKNLAIFALFGIVKTKDSVRELT